MPVTPEPRAALDSLREFGPMAPLAGGGRRGRLWPLLLSLLMTALLAGLALWLVPRLMGPGGLPAGLPGAGLPGSGRPGAAGQPNGSGAPGALPSPGRALSGVQLAGSRGPTPLSVVLLLDESTSFADYADIRDTVITELAAWAPANLRPDDVVTVVGFAEDATLRLAPTAVAGLGPGTVFDDGPPIGIDTHLVPALHAAAAVNPDMDSTLIIVTDTLAKDIDPALIEGLVKDLQATSTTTIMPTGVDVSAPWQAALPWSNVLHADPAVAADTEFALAQAIALATGQTLKDAP